MLDLIFLAAIVGFFFIAIAYIAFCDSLSKKEKEK